MYEAQLAREAMAPPLWGKTSATMEPPGGMWSQQAHYSLAHPPEQQYPGIIEQDFAEPPSPSPPSAEQVAQLHLDGPLYASAAHHQLFNTSPPTASQPRAQPQQFGYASTSALLAAVGDQSFRPPPPPTPHHFARSRADQALIPSKHRHDDDGDSEMADFWKRAPKPARADDFQVARPLQAHTRWDYS